MTTVPTITALGVLTGCLVLSGCSSPRFRSFEGDPPPGVAVSVLGVQSRLAIYVPPPPLDPMPERQDLSPQEQRDRSVIRAAAEQMRRWEPPGRGDAIVIGVRVDGKIVPRAEGRTGMRVSKTEGTFGLAHYSTVDVFQQVEVLPGDHDVAVTFEVYLPQYPWDSGRVLRAEEMVQLQFVALPGKAYLICNNDLLVPETSIVVEDARALGGHGVRVVEVLE